jgi:uncharacterized damage-inducible protein DinB
VDVADLLLELYGRIPPLAREVVADLEPEQLRERPTLDANPIAWLVWHTGRIQDHHVAEVMDTDQIWTTSDFAPRFELEPDPDNTGFGHTSEEVAAVRPESADVLIEYLEAVDARTREFLAKLTPDDLDRIVDRRWDPPVTLGVRLVSVAEDGLQHMGQAAYLRGLLGF